MSCFWLKTQKTIKLLIITCFEAIAFICFFSVLAMGTDIQNESKVNLSYLIFAPSNAAEVNGIKLKTVLLNRAVTIPINESDAGSSMRFGVTVTNNTSTAVRFSLDSFQPKFLSLNEEVPLSVEIQISVVLREESDFPLLLPSQSLTLLWEANFYWNENNIYVGVSERRYSRSRSYGPFKPGVVQVWFTYDNTTSDRWYFDREKRERRQLKGVLTGPISSFSEEFSLLLP